MIYLGTISWYDMYKKCKTLGIGNSSVTTSMIWGILWDETLDWLVSSNAKTYETVGEKSFSWGNYYQPEFTYYTNKNNMNETAIKKAGVQIRIPTGSTEYTKANNIYDMAGNVFDFTLEAGNDENDVDRYRVCRGGAYTIKTEFTNYPAAKRDKSFPTSSGNDYGCRAMLLIN